MAPIARSAPSGRDKAAAQSHSTSRGQRADGAVTRERILLAAGHLIGERGFAHVKGRDIAEHAGVDVASINYHFGSRARLYETLLVEAHTRLIGVDELSAIVEGGQPPEDRLRLLIARVTARAMGDDGWSVRVLAREILGPSSHFAALRPLIAQKFGIAVKLFAELTGLAPDDPRLVLNAITTAAPFGAIVLLRRSFGSDLASLSQVPTGGLVDHLTRFVMAGLRGVSDAA